MAFFPAVGENTSSVPLLKNLQKLSFFGCQWQLMCRQEWQMIIRLRSLKNQSSYIYKSFSTQHREHHIITSTHSQIIIFLTMPGCDLVVRMRVIVHVQLSGVRRRPPLHTLLARVCCSNCGRLLWSVVHVAVHFRLFQERYSRARRQRKISSTPYSLEHQSRCCNCKFISVDCLLVGTWIYSGVVPLL